MQAKWAILCFGLGICSLLTGCGRSSQASDPEVARQRSQFLLADEPADAIGIMEYRELEHQAGAVVLVGRVGGQHETWSPGAAAFVISDPAVALAAEGHAHPCDDGCAFCKKRKENLMASHAIVQFKNAQGQIVPHDARDLFHLEEHQTVVVEGHAEVDSLGHLVVSARGIYVRR